MRDLTTALLPAQDIHPPTPAQALRGDIDQLTDLAERMLDELAVMAATLEEMRL